MECLHGCGSTDGVGKKICACSIATPAVTSFAVNVPLGILASQKNCPALVGLLRGYIAAFILAKSTEFDYGEGGHHISSGGVDWYGMNNDLYSEYLVYGIRMDGQQQYEARQHELEPYNYNYVLAHIRHDGHDYAAVVKRPWKSRSFRRYPRGLNFRIRIPPPPTPKSKVTIVDTFSHDTSVPFRSVFPHRPPDTREGSLADGERILYGKITHHFTSDHAQVRIEAIQEGDKLIELSEEDVVYDVFPRDRIQQERSKRYCTRIK